MSPNSATSVKQKYLGKEVVSEELMKDLRAQADRKASWASLMEQVWRLVWRRMSIAGVAECSCAAWAARRPSPPPILLSVYPTMAKAVQILLSAHATTGAAERNWYEFGSAYSS
jgi:hypothetical protein